VVAIAIFALRRVIAVSITFRVNHFVARLSLQGNRRRKVFGEGRAIRGEQGCAAQHGWQYQREKRNA
jgi:hypothetical protein